MSDGRRESLRLPWRVQKRCQGHRREAVHVDADVELPRHRLQPAVAVPVQVQRSPVLSVPSAEGVMAEDEGVPSTSTSA